MWTLPYAGTTRMFIMMTDLTPTARIPEARPINSGSKMILECTPVDQPKSGNKIEKRRVF
jgi:hypothetical protein